MAKEKYCRISFGFDGKRYFVRGKTKLEANVTKELKLKELENGKQELTNNITVAKWAIEWLETYKEPTVNTKHYKDINSVINRFIFPSNGHLKLRQVVF